MKICYLADAADIHTQKWVKYFADKGHEVHLISFQSLPDPINGVNLHLLKEVCSRVKLCKYAINALFIFIQIRKSLKEIKPDIVHGHSVRDHTIITALTGFRPFVVSAWGSDILIKPKESKVMKYAVPFALRNADIITCDGENTKEAMIKMGIEKEKIALIMHGVDTRKFNSFYANEKLREELTIFDSPTVISTRRLGSIHDVGTIIKAIPLVLKEIPNVKFIIVGEGGQKQYLTDLANSLNVFNTTRFVGWIPNDKLPGYLSSSNVYVSTSLSDGGVAVSTLEAMACELPCIVTNVGDNTKWIKNDENGFIVHTKDSKALAGKIIYLLENEDIRKEFGKKNRKIIEEKQNYYKGMEKMENIYIELVERYKT